MSVDRLDKRYLCRFVAITSVALVLMPGTVVFAGVLAGDGNAMAGWHDTAVYTGSWGGFGVPPFFYADLDYAVYAPGMFNETFLGQDPSGGNDYVYAYQIFNTGAVTDQSIVQLTVGFDGDEVVRNIGSFGTGQAPDSNSFQGSGPTSAAWFYDQNPLPPGAAGPASSNILIYTSLRGPEWDTGTLLGTGTTVDRQDVPSPLPEPATLLLLGVAAGVFLIFRRARRRSIM